MKIKDTQLGPSAPPKFIQKHIYHSPQYFQAKYKRHVSEIRVSGEAIKFSKNTNEITKKQCNCSIGLSYDIWLPMRRRLNLKTI
jgi:Zn/Cd-binding protein ZinT